MREMAVRTGMLDGRDELDAAQYRELLGCAAGVVAEICAAGLADAWAAS